MNRIQDFPIGTRIIAVVLVVVILELSISIVSIYFLNSVNNNLNKIVDIQVENVKLGARINRHLTEIKNTEQNLISSYNKINTQRYASESTEHKNELELSLARMKVLMEGENLVLLNQFDSAYRDYFQIDNQIQSIILSTWQPVTTDDGEMEAEVLAAARNEAVGLAENRGNDAYARANSLIQSIQESTDQDLADTKFQSDQKAATARGIMIGLATISIGAGLILGLLISRSISNGLGEMVSVADSIAAGKLETSINVKGKDEVGRLSTAISRMQTSLKIARVESSAQDWLKTG
ncbi:MAG: HAMP domain-containing protein, partial [Anaerolineales bacterium]|nr:HAMP domain-containing protein [Anaerolineales bacterium]